MAGCHPSRRAAGLTGDGRHAASAVQGLGAAGIAGGASGGCGQVVLLLLLLCILLSAPLAAVILRGERRAPLSGTGNRAPAPLLIDSTRDHLPQAEMPSLAKLSPFLPLLLVY